MTKNTQSHAKTTHRFARGNAHWFTKLIQKLNKLHKNITQITKQKANYQGCGSATRFHDCSTKKKIKQTCSQQPHTLSRVGPSLTPDHRRYITRRNTKFVLADYTKGVRPTLLIWIWILAFCLCNPLIFLFYSVEQIISLTLVVSLHSSLPGIARYRRSRDCMKISLSLFSIFCLP